jgi:hypothetical protein
LQLSFPFEQNYDFKNTIIYGFLKRKMLTNF